MLWKIDITKDAKKDLEYFRDTNKNLYVKCFDVLQDILISPEQGIGKPEKLRYFKGNFYSRRISKEHRCVYEINNKDQAITFYSFRKHYE